jgi:hypothetical protein
MRGGLLLRPSFNWRGAELVGPVTPPGQGKIFPRDLTPAAAAPTDKLCAKASVVDLMLPATTGS